MNLNQIVNMLFRMVLRKAVNKGVNAGFDRMAGGANGKSKRHRQAMKNAKQAARVTRRLNRF